MKTQNVYSIITDRIIALLEKGVVPWQKPWAAKTENQSPRNLISKKPYRGINSFLLNSMGFESPYWLSFNQAKASGGMVRKGEKACPVVFWKWLEVEEKETGEKKKIPLLRYFSVFNVLQCAGIPVPEPEKKTEREHNPIESAERIFAGMPKPPELKHGGDRACYWPCFDRVEMPKPESFQTGQHYYSVLFHELTHSTGHDSRLNRKGISGTEGKWSAFGSTPYAKEELVAEMGAAFLCAHAGIVERTLENSTAYISGWLERLRNDNRLVVTAAAQAQKASDWILGNQSEKAGETPDPGSELPFTIPPSFSGGEFQAI